MKVTGEGQRSQKLTNGHTLQTVTLTDIIPGTKVQYNKRHLMIKMKVTLVDDEGHRRRSKVTKIN